MTKFVDVMPRLPVADVGRTVAFYKTVLGFEVDVLFPDDGSTPSFVILIRYGVTVAFYSLNEHHGDARIGYAELSFEVEGIIAFHERLKDSVPIEWGPEVYSYGRREFALRDPDRYLVIFSERTNDPATTDEPG